MLILTRAHDQQPRDEDDTHDHQRLLEDLTTPATPKHSYLTAQTWEQAQHQQMHQELHRVQRLERRAAGMLRLPRVRRHPSQETLVGITLIADICRVARGLRRPGGYEQHLSLTKGRSLLGPPTPRLAHPRQQTGHSLTSPRHFVHFAAVDMTSA